MIDEDQYTSVIQLGSLPSIGLLVLCLFLVLKARPEIATGIYLTIGAWGHTLRISNIAQTWVLLATMFGAAFIFYNKNRDFQLPKNDRWIIPLVSLWWFWSMILIFFSETLDNRYLAYFILNTIVPIPVILSYSHRINRIESFSIAYIFTTMVGGLVLLQYINTNYPVFLINPLTGNYGMGRLPIRNYHAFSYPYGISIIMLLSLFCVRKTMIARFVCICSITYCFYFLYYAGSRQAIFSTLIGCILFIYWFIKNKHIESEVSNFYIRSRTIFLMIVIAYLIYYLVEGSPITLFRETEVKGVAGLYAIAEAESRWGTWQTAIQQILDSYFMGTIYGSGNTHNFFLSVLANEGIFGFILMSGFFIFFIKQTRNIWTLKEISTIAIWRMTFFCIFLSTIIHSQFSGDNISAPELFWSVIFLWYSNEDSQVMQSEIVQ